jgi:hypothetical protein
VSITSLLRGDSNSTGAATVELVCRGEWFARVTLVSRHG